MNCVTVGKTNMGYVNVDLDTLKAFMGGNFNLNEKKYLEGKKKSKTVYTVVGLVSSSFEYKSFRGYIVADDKGNVDIVKENKLVELLKKNYFMNYSLSSTTQGSVTNYFPRKNPKVEVKDYLNMRVRDLLGYNFEDFTLSPDMNIKQLDFCMKNNGFKLGFEKEFPAKYYGKDVVGIHLVYYNKEGTLIVLNCLPETSRPLGYYGQDCMLMRDVDYKKYHNYLKENSYMGGSSYSLEDTTTEEILPNHGKMVFAFTEVFKFLASSERAKCYSKPVLPYELGSDRYGLNFILYITPYERDKIKEYCDKNNLTDYSYKSFMNSYMGYLNMSVYSEGLRRNYSKIAGELSKYFDSFIASKSKGEVQDMIKYLENLM